MMARTPLILFCALLGLVGARGRAHAQTGTAGTGGTSSSLTKDDFFLELRRYNEDKERYEPVTTNDMPFVLNNANCECETKVAIYMQLTAAGRTKLASGTVNPTGGATIVLGDSACVAESEVNRNIAHCVKLDQSKITASDLLNGLAVEVKTTVSTLFEAVRGTGPVCERVGSINASVFVDFDSRSGIPDLTDTNAPSLSLSPAGTGPAAPTGVKVEGGNEALTVSWTATTAASNLAGYVVLCARDGDKRVFDKSFRTTIASSAQLCPEKFGGSNAIWRSANADYACSTLLALDTSPSKRIQILQNGIPYLVGVTAVDRNGNASPIETVLVGVPTPTENFYGAYRAAGGEAEGGFCAMGRGHPRTLAVSGIIFGAAALVLARRGRGRKQERVS